MAYDELLADRIRIAFADAGADFSELKMMGGLCFKVDDKMCCGLLSDKKSGEALFMIRVGEEVAEKLLESDDPNIEPMDFTGRPMKGYLYVTEAGLKSERSLKQHVQRCLDFNPLAKASKKKKKD